MLKKKNFVIQEAFSKREMQLYEEKMPEIAIEIEKLPKSSDYYRFDKFLTHLLA